MREILFRGKRLDNGEWICSGNLITFNSDNGKPSFLNFIPEYNAKCICSHDEADNIIGFENCLFAKVAPETVGQYTGLTDKNGKKIFEGDILEAHFDEFFPDSATRVSVAWHSAGFVIKQNETLWDALLPEDREEWEVIGNIYDNPDLLQEV